MIPSRKFFSALYPRKALTLVLTSSLSTVMSPPLIAAPNFPHHRSRSSKAYSTKAIIHEGQSTNTGPSARGGSYEDAIRLLNTLQSNATSIKAAVNTKRTQSDEALMGDCVRVFERSGLTVEQLDTLNIVHVAGTKGKGTTCAFVESILRHAGLRTGFFSSPHLVSVRERIRINARPISKEKFAKYFFEVYRNLENTKEPENDMPFYFRFLTYMAFYTFYFEKVDAVILEVGIGGKLDSTNIIRKPIVTGIVSLGLEHQNILGQTLEEISLQKAGIMKPNVPCFTVPTHPTRIIQLLKNYAGQVKCPLILAPPLEAYEKVPDLMVDTAVTHLNASLAIQLAKAFIQNKFVERLSDFTTGTGIGQPISLSPWEHAGISNCFWPARFQILRQNPHLTYFLDGAHTVESLAAAQDWFTRAMSKDQSTVQILVFNVTGDRNSEELLRPFAISELFHSAVFCPIVTFDSANSAGDNWSKLQSDQNQNVMERSKALGFIWDRLTSGQRPCVTIPSVNAVLEHLNEISRVTKIQVLVTGSLHLVGAFLSILDPELTSGTTKKAGHNFPVTREQ